MAFEANGFIYYPDIEVRHLLWFGDTFYCCFVI